MHDVLIFTPVLRLEPETVHALMMLEWEGPLSLLLQRDNPTGNPYLDHLHQYQRGREMFLRGDYESMLIIESDIIPPPDTIKKLAALDADCAYGVYRFRGSNIINVFERYPDNPDPPRNPGESLSIWPEKLKKAIEEGLTLCSGGGIGCILIRRHVLEETEFRIEQTGHCDTYFNRDVMHKGFTQKADMSVICGHKQKDGTILWPEYP